MIEARVTYRVDRRAFDGLMRAECRKRMRATVEALVGESRRIVPVRTGNLKSSLTAEVSADGLTGWYGSNRPWRGEASVHYACVAPPFPILAGFRAGAAPGTSLGHQRRIYLPLRPGPCERAGCV